MPQESFNLLSVIISVTSLLITLVGLYALYFQIKKIRESAWSNTHSKLCDQSFELLRFFSANPKTYDYFYNKKELDEKEPDRIFILYATEALANFMEHLVLQKESLPVKQWEVWKRFIYTTFEASLIIRSFIMEHKEWYSSGLIAIAEECAILYPGSAPSIETAATSIISN
ncbi:MAG: hypothetical protein ABJA78_14995 [Ferruginibacter sp.]